MQKGGYKTPNGKFHTGALQSIIDNLAVVFDYEFINAPTNTIVGINPVEFWPAVVKGTDGGWHGQDVTAPNAPGTGTSTVSGSSSPTTNSNTSQNAKQGAANPNSNPNGANPNEQDSSYNQFAALAEPLKQYENTWGNQEPPILKRGYPLPGK